MAGMDAGPGTDLGALGWFLGVWVVMMAAMMFPSVAPTVALYAQMTRRRGLEPPAAVYSGYLLVWGAAGVAAYGLFGLGRTLFGADLAWHTGGRWLAGGVLVSPRSTSSRRSRTCVWRSAAARSGSCSAAGATGREAPWRWAPGTPPGALAAAGR